MNQLVSHTLNGKRGKRDDGESETFIASTLKSQRGKAGGGIGPEETLIAQGGAQQDQFVSPDGIAPTLAHSSNTHQGHHQPKVMNGSDVRRLTPTECERLQALPDGWTQLGDTPDSRRYAALGDAVTASVAEWIGRRLAA